jgi:hypothetical protein
MLQGIKFKKKTIYLLRIIIFICSSAGKSGANGLEQTLL